MKMKRILTYLLTFSLLFGLLPTAALAAPPEEGGVSTLTEKSVEVSSWTELTQAVQNLSATEYLNATITQSLEANSQLLIDGKTVVLTTNTDGISIKRTLTAKTSSSDSRIAPMFYLQNGASLTINGGEKGIKLTANDVSGNGKKSNSLILAQTDTTLSLSNVSFADFTFGYSQNTSSFGAIRTFNATVTLNDVSMTNCTAANGVLICANNSKVNMNRCVVTNTKYWGNENNNGGVVWVRGADSDVTIDGCEIRNCGSAEPEGKANSGGPIWLTGGNLPTGQTTGGTTRILNSTISGNTAMRGAGILAMNTNLILSNVNITNNTCFGDSDNKVWWQGAGLYIHTCSVSMTNVKITGNKGAFLGGGVFIQGPVDTKGNAVPEVTMDAGTEISGNSAVCGGGIYVGQGLSIVRLNGTKIKDNTAVKNTNYEDYPEYNGCGGGIANDYETVVLNNAEISGNTADAHGGGIMNWGKTTITGGSVTGNQAGVNDEDGCGGGICIADWKVHIEGDTAISGNTADCGNGVYVGGSATFEIQDSVAIAPENDVALEKNAYITVSDTFTGATEEKPISISSQDTNIEDLKADPPTDGTPLVLYTEEAGGVEAAKAADLAEIFVPSQYMQEELLIGQSQKENDGQYLTYVKERNIPNYDVTYKDNSTKQQATEQVPYGTQIAIDPNGGTLDWLDSVWDNTRGSEKQMLTITGSITIPDPTQSGHTFLGWEKTNVEGVLTLTAQWSKNPSGDDSGSSDSGYTLRLTKLDAADDTPLGGAKFELWRVGKKSDAKVGTYTTNRFGWTQASVSSSGDYYWIEITPPEGYQLDESKYPTDTGKNKSITVYNSKTSTPVLLTDDHFAYVIGMPDGTVRPEANITRAEVATIFFRLLREDVREKNMSASNPFPDVTEGAWYNHAVSTLWQMGILKGSDDGKFHPNDSITRAEFAAIAARFSDTKVTGATAAFNDIANHWARDEINYAAALGWVNGWTDGGFHPDVAITRAEAMTLVNRVLNRNPRSKDALLGGMVEWPDNADTSKWYYLAVQEATNSHDYERDGSYEKWTGMDTAPNWTRYEN